MTDWTPEDQTHQTEIQQMLHSIQALSQLATSTELLQEIAALDAGRLDIVPEDVDPDHPMVAETVEQIREIHVKELARRNILITSPLRRPTT